MPLFYLSNRIGETTENNAATNMDIQNVKCCYQLAAHGYATKMLVEQFSQNGHHQRKVQFWHDEAEDVQRLYDKFCVVFSLFSSFAAYQRQK